MRLYLHFNKHKFSLVLTFLCVGSIHLSSQSVGINTIPHPNASLDVSGVNKGLLIPRGDAATRISLTSNTAKGLMMYDTTTSTIWLHNGNGDESGWQSLSNGSNHWKLSGALGTEITNTNTDGFWSAYATTVLSDPGLISPPVSGPGTRFMWIPQKSAFRVGSTDAGHWDAENIGLFSFAGGLNTIANNTYSFSMGAGTSSKGLASTSLGWFTSATGHSSVSAGFKTRAKSYSSFAIGRWNDSISISNNIEWINTDPIFMIGNGKSENTRHNAMVVYKNGNMVLKNPSPFYVNKLPVDYEVPIEGEGTRMMWLPEIGAFRVGSAIDSAWNSDKIGFGSFAAGINATASGFNTLAAGLDTKASGSMSVAFGYANNVRGYSAVAIGMFNDPVLTADEDEWAAPESPLFMIGNGDDYNDRHNAMIVRKDGHVGIGTNVPDVTLHVNGQLKVVDGTQGGGKILTSDVNGLASWQPPPPPPPAPTYVSSISICCQSWMTKNLDVSTYRNGDAIPKVTSNSAWAALTTGAYCYFNNDSTTYAATYGKIYNWYAVNDPRGLAPEGWHIPTGFEMMTLTDCLGGTSVAGGLLKERGTTHWTTPNTGATNLSGFTGLPGGLRSETGTFSGDGIEGPYWGVTEYDSIDSYYMSMAFNSASATVFHFKKKTGFYVRCIRD